MIKTRHFLIQNLANARCAHLVTEANNVVGCIGVICAQNARDLLSQIGVRQFELKKRREVASEKYVCKPMHMRQAKKAGFCRMSGLCMAAGNGVHRRQLQSGLATQTMLENASLDLPGARDLWPAATRQFRRHCSPNEPWSRRAAAAREG